MFDGLNNNRSHWNELAEVYNAKMKAIEDEKKRLEEEEARKGKDKEKCLDEFQIKQEQDRSSRIYSSVSFLFCLCSWWWWYRWSREVKDLHHLLGFYNAWIWTDTVCLGLI